LYAVIGTLGCILLVFMYVFVMGIDRVVSDAYLKDFDPRSYGM
jgi:hypothetical protein